VHLAIGGERQEEDALLTGRKVVQAPVASPAMARPPALLSCTCWV
jgi:hypothetical protein